MELVERYRAYRDMQRTFIGQRKPWLMQDELVEETRKLAIVQRQLAVKAKRSAVSMRRVLVAGPDASPKESKSGAARKPHAAGAPSKMPVDAGHAAWPGHTWSPGEPKSVRSPTEHEVEMAESEAKAEATRAIVTTKEYCAEKTKLRVRVVNIDAGNADGSVCSTAKMSSSGMSFFVQSVLQQLHPRGNDYDVILTLQNPGSRANARQVSEWAANHLNVDFALYYHSPRLATIVPLLTWPRVTVPAETTTMATCQVLAMTHHTGTELGVINVNAVLPSTKGVRTYIKADVPRLTMELLEKELLDGARCLPTLWVPVMVCGEFRQPLVSGSPLSIVLGRLVRERQLLALPNAPRGVSSMESLLQGSCAPSTCHSFVNQLVLDPHMQFARLRVAYAGQTNRRSSALAAASPPPMPGYGRLFEWHPDTGLRPDLEEALKLASCYDMTTPLEDQVPAGVPYEISFCLTRRPSKRLWFGGVTFVSPAQLNCA